MEGNTVWLKGTTLEEIEQAHRIVLMQAVDHANGLEQERLGEHSRQTQQKREFESDFRKQAREAAERIKFD